MSVLIHTIAATVTLAISGIEIGKIPYPVPRAVNFQPNAHILMIIILRTNVVFMSSEVSKLANHSHISKTNHPKVKINKKNVTTVQNHV